VNQARSMLEPAGPTAHTLAELGWPLLIGFTVTAAVMWALLVWLACRRTGTFVGHAPVEEGGGKGWVYVGGIIVPGLAFGAAFVATVGVLTKFPMKHHHDGAAEIRVTGRQWWWEVQYRPTANKPDWFTTANEIHIPIGRPVTVELVSNDVIHSFWVPRLGGKVDLVPGMTNAIELHASEPGVYEGACAEFCGLQHAKMRFQVIADEPGDYQRWLEQQRRPAQIAGDAQAERGERIFMNSACPMCHTVTGTAALATVGPDLTHVGSRRSIGAGWLPKDLATTHAWVMNAPALKPGTRMPALSHLSGQELHDLVSYLEALQ
jgi:cytochrome c oxidase subunit 2